MVFGFKVAWSDNGSKLFIWIYIDSKKRGYAIGGNNNIRSIEDICVNIFDFWVNETVDERGEGDVVAGYSRKWRRSVLWNAGFNEVKVALFQIEVADSLID